MSETPQSGTPDDPTRPADTRDTSAQPVGPPTRWQRSRAASRPSSWTRRTAVVVSGVVGLLLGALLCGIVLATTVGGAHGDGSRDRGPGVSADGRGPGGSGGPGGPGGRGDGDGRGGPRGDRGQGGAGGPVVVQVQPGATVQVAPGAIVQAVPGQPAQPAPVPPAQPGQPAPLPG
jgi:hypothetical protein